MPPESLPFSIIIMPESLFLLCFLGSVLFAVRYLLDPYTSRLWPAFALLGCSVMFKPVSLPFTLVLVLAAILRSWRRPALRGTVMLAVFGGLLVEGAICSPWLIRNYVVFRSASFSTITGSNLYWYNYKYMLLDKGLPSVEVERILAQQIERVAAETPGYEHNPFIQSRALTRLVVSRILAEPFAYARTVAKRYPNLYGGTGAMEILHMMSREPHAPGAPLDQVYRNHPALRPLRILMSILLCIWYALIIAGAVALVRRKQWVPLLVACIPILYFSAMYGPVTGSRYRFVMNPFFALSAAYAIPKRFIRDDSDTAPNDPRRGVQSPPRIHF